MVVCVCGAPVSPGSGLQNPQTYRHPILWEAWSPCQSVVCARAMLYTHTYCVGEWRNPLDSLLWLRLCGCVRWLLLCVTPQKCSRRREGTHTTHNTHTQHAHTHTPTPKGRPGGEIILGRPHPPLWGHLIIVVLCRAAEELIRNPGAQEEQSRPWSMEQQNATSCRVTERREPAPFRPRAKSSSRAQSGACVRDGARSSVVVSLSLTYQNHPPSSKVPLGSPKGHTAKSHAAPPLGHTTWNAAPNVPGVCVLARVGACVGACVSACVCRRVGVVSVCCCVARRATRCGGVVRTHTHPPTHAAHTTDHTPPHTTTHHHTHTNCGRRLDHTRHHETQQRTEQSAQQQCLSLSVGQSRKSGDPLRGACEYQLDLNGKKANT